MGRAPTGRSGEESSGRRHSTCKGPEQGQCDISRSIRKMHVSRAASKGDLSLAEVDNTADVSLSGVSLAQVSSRF